MPVSIDSYGRNEETSYATKSNEFLVNLNLRHQFRQGYVTSGLRLITELFLNDFFEKAHD
jgi:hypothetical protein